MKKLIALIFIALFLLASSAYAATMSEFWNKLDTGAKRLIILGYKEGLRDGIAIAQQPDSEEPAEIMKVATHQHKVAEGTYKNIYTTELGKIVSGIDTFYSNNSNLDISLDYAILYATQRQNGISEEEAQKDLVQPRKTISAQQRKNISNQ